MKKFTLIFLTFFFLSSFVVAEKIGKVKQLISLDPPYKILDEYDIDTKGDEFSSYKNKSDFSRCFTGKGSFPGSDTINRTCDETFYIDFQKPVEERISWVKKIINNTIYFVSDRLNFLDKHGEVIDKYIDIISTDKFYNNILDLNNENNNFQKENKISGNIYTKDGEEINYLKVKTKNKPNYITKYGTIKNNLLKCDEKQNCILYGYYGDDEFRQSNSFIIKDFRKERIIKHQEPKKDADKLILKKDFEINIFQGNLDEKNGVAVNLHQSSWLAGVINRQVFLEGVSESDVKGWLEDAQNKTIKSREYKKLPIQIE